MHSLSASQKNKSSVYLTEGLKQKKISPQMIQYFKNTVEIPIKNFKQNQFPKQPVANSNGKENYQMQSGKDKNLKIKKGKVIQCDISTIADSYVLEGNKLRKHQSYEETMKKQHIKQSECKKKQKNEKHKQTQTVNRKQIIKLEYLQKMGFLRPDEKQILAQYRKLYPENGVSSPMHAEHKNHGGYAHQMNNISYCSPSQQYDANILPHYFSPNPKANYQSSHFVY